MDGKFLEFRDGDYWWMLILGRTEREEMLVAEMVAKIEIDSDREIWVREDKFWEDNSE